MLAANNGHKDVILTLIERGANLDLVNAVLVCIRYIINLKCHHFQPTMVAIYSPFVLLIFPSNC